jgi:hypothetical protein
MFRRNAWRAPPDLEQCRADAKELAEPQGRGFAHPFSPHESAVGASHIAQDESDIGFRDPGMVS